MPGVDACMIVDAARAAGAQSVDLVRDMRDVPGALADGLEAGDVVLVMGAGSINQICGHLLDALERGAGKGGTP